MEIQIVYQTWDGIEPISLSLSPEAYFDPLEPGEKYETDAIPRYNHTWQYLDLPRNKLKWSIERRPGTTIITQYMDGGRSWMTHRKDSDGYEKIIHSTRITEQSCHILRTFKAEGGAWTVHYNGVIVDQENGSQKEQCFDQPWSFEEAAALAGVKIEN